MVESKIKVIQIVPELEEGGVEKGTLEIGAYLAKQGCESIVISAGGRMTAQLEKEGSRHIACKHIGSKSPKALACIPKLRNLFLKEKPDIIHLRSRVPAWLAYLAYKSIPGKLRPKLVTTFHGFYSVNGYSKIMTKGEKVIAVSKVVSEHIQKEYGVNKDRIVVIYRGVDEEFLDQDSIQDERIDELKKKWNITKNNDNILFLLPGRLTRLKGHDLVINSLSEFNGDRWQLLVVGGIDRTSSYFKELTELAIRNGTKERIIFTGYCSDMPAAIKLADVVISASLKPESFGRTIIEAQAMGKPVIASAHGGALEIVDDRKTGWLFTPNDKVSLTNAIASTFTSPEDRKQFGKNGHKKVEKKFRKDEMCRKTLEVYKNNFLQWHHK